MFRHGVRKAKSLLKIDVCKGWQRSSSKYLTKSISITMSLEWIAQATFIVGKPVQFSTAPCVSQHEHLCTQTHIVLGWKRGHPSSVTTDTAECAGQETYSKWFPLLSHISVFFYWLNLSIAIQNWKKRLTTINGTQLLDRNLRDSTGSLKWKTMLS